MTPAAQWRPEQAPASPARAPDTTRQTNPPSEQPTSVDCDRCRARGPGCPDCMVTFLLGGPPDDVSFDPEERRAIDVLVAAGMIPPLRMVQSVDTPGVSDSA